MFQFLKVKVKIKSIGSFWEVDSNRLITHGWEFIKGGNHWWQGAPPTFIIVLVISEFLLKQIDISAHNIDIINMCDPILWNKKYLTLVSNFLISSIFIRIGMRNIRFNSIENHIITQFLTINMRIVVDRVPNINIDFVEDECVSIIDTLYTRI